MSRDLAIDTLLVAGFGVQHSVLATLGVKSRLARRSRMTPLLWRGVQSYLNVAYIFVAIALWQNSGDSIWHLDGGLGTVVAVICVFGWLSYFYLHLFEYDAGLAFGSSPAICILRGERAPKMELWKVGSRRWIRFPVHTAFFPMFFAFPEMAASTLVFAVTANVYNIIGTILYDRRLEKLGEVYTNYRKVTGNILPRLRLPQGAAGLEFSSPTHWRHPLEYSTAALFGILGGVFYWGLLGRASQAPEDLLACAAAGTLLALVAGVLIGRLPHSRFTVGVGVDSFPGGQIRLATAGAVVSATALTTWFAIAAVISGAVPYVPVVLPMWLITLWLGHLVLAIALRPYMNVNLELRSDSGTRTA